MLGLYNQSILGLILKSHKQDIGNYGIIFVSSPPA